MQEASFSDKTLHVAIAYVNPLRSQNRERLAKEFVARMQRTPNVKAYVGEIAFGDRDFVLTEEGRPTHFRFRTSSELWHKERLLKLLINRFDLGWEYGCYWDADFTMSRHDWALETIHQLQHFPWVQPFSSLLDTTDLHRPMRPIAGFAFNYHRNSFKLPEGYVLPLQPGMRVRGAEYRCPQTVDGTPLRKSRWAGATGGGWAFRRQSYEDCGGLLDTCCLGSADWHMTFGLAGAGDLCHPDLLHCGKNYAQAILNWQRRAWASVRGRIGYVDNLALHGWHGPRSKRGYAWRWQILRDHDFDPKTDVVDDVQGLWKFAGNKPRMELAFGAYMRSRSEDLPHLDEAPLI